MLYIRQLSMTLNSVLPYLHFIIR